MDHRPRETGVRLRAAVSEQRSLQRTAPAPETSPVRTSWLTRRLEARVEDGVSLVEVVVALIVFALFSTALAATIMQTQRTSGAGRNRVVAADLVQGALEQVRDLPESAIPVGSSSSTQLVGATTYTLIRNVQLAQDTVAVSPCDSGSTNRLAYKRITETATWPTIGGTPAVRADTLRSVNIVGSDAAKGALAVKVAGVSAPDSGITVALTNVSTGASLSSLVTGEDGCVVFDAVPVGTWRATLTAGAGTYVDPQSNVAPAQPQSVSAGVLTRLSFQYDRGAYLTLAPSLTGAPTDLTATLYNTGFTPVAARPVLSCPTTAPCLSGAGTRASTAVYPATAGYQVWGGTCADADPSASVNAGSRAAALSVTPGGTTSGTIAVTALTVTYTGTSAATVYATHVADSACAAGETLTLGTMSPGTRPTISLPYGTWVISRNATPHTATTSDQTATVRPSGASASGTGVS